MNPACMKNNIIWIIFFKGLWKEQDHERSSVSSEFSVFWTSSLFGFHFIDWAGISGILTFFKVCASTFVGLGPECPACQSALWLNALFLYIALPSSSLSGSETVVASNDFALLLSLQRIAGQKLQVEVTIVHFSMLKQETLIKGLCLPCGECCQKCQGNVSLSGLSLYANANPLLLVLV